MIRRNENHGLSNCTGWTHCQDCGGVCSTDPSDEPYTDSGQWIQAAVEIPGPSYLDRYRNYLVIK